MIIPGVVFALSSQLDVETPGELIYLFRDPGPAVTFAAARKLPDDCRSVELSMTDAGDRITPCLERLSARGAKWITLDPPPESDDSELTKYAVDEVIRLNKS